MVSGQYSRVPLHPTDAEDATGVGESSRGMQPSSHSKHCGVRRCYSIAVLSTVFGALVIFTISQVEIPPGLRYYSHYSTHYSTINNRIDREEEEEEPEVPQPVLTSSQSSKILSEMVAKVRVSNSTSQLKSCTKPVNKVGFMKTHKTASSTLQNILLRYGREHSWNFIMYQNGNHLGPPSDQYDLSRPFNSRWVKYLPWSDMIEEKGYNAFLIHTMWNHKEVAKLLGPDAAYFTVLRNPVDQFESMYNYVHFEKEFRMDLETFIQTYVKANLPVRRVQRYLGRNQQFWDLGYKSSDLDTPQHVQEKIGEIDANFDLVLIAEDFEASLVLLSEVLCWPLETMTSLRVNARKESAVEKLSASSRQLLSDWLWADTLLYNYFKEKLQHQKARLGKKRMVEAVAQLAKLNKALKADCVEETVQDTKFLDKEFRPWSEDVLAFRVNEWVEGCKYFAMSENHFIELVRKLQVERWLEWSSERGPSFAETSAGGV